MRQRLRICGILMLILSIILITPLSGCDQDTVSGERTEETKGPAPEIEKVGDVIQFGGYAWTVLEIKEDCALILCDKVELQIPRTRPDTGEEMPGFWGRPYHLYTTSDDYINRRAVTWETCSLREDLNNIFYQSFSSTDRARIIKTTVTTEDNPEYGTDGGNDTQDYVFLLDISEAERYFENDNGRIARDSEGKSSDWWLRSTGNVGYCVAYVSMSGNVVAAGVDVGDPNSGARPALWLDLTD